MISATTGTITGGFRITDDYISQPFSLTGGRAVYRFDVTSAGEYAVVAVVDAPTEGNNSFFVNVNAEPLDPASVWHIPVTSGFQVRTASWQGSGTWDSPQFVPKYFNLPVGVSEVIILGREGNTKLRSISLVKRPLPPDQLSVGP